jgi:hypothetical protein
MLSLGLGKKFLQIICFLLDFKVNLPNPWRSIRAYTLHQYISFIGIEKAILQRLLQGVKGLTPL